MKIVPLFDVTMKKRLPEACALLESANLTIHESVSRIVLLGSGGLAGGHKQYSDIDLTLIINIPKRVVRADFLCSEDGSGCFGVYKSEKGFRGIVKGDWVQAPLMYPCLVLWQR